MDITERKQAEQALIDSEYLLRESQKVAVLGSYILDIPSGYWESSQVLDDLFGIDEKYTRDIANWAPIIHPDDRVMMQEYFATNVLKDHEPFNKEYRIQRINDQQVRWVHGLGKLEFTDDGIPIKMIGTIQDITDRKKAENDLKESAERHRVFFEESPMLNWQYNLNPPMPINLPLEEQIDWILHKTVLVDVNLEKSDLRGTAVVALGTNLYKNWGENEEIGSKIARDFINQNYSLEKYEAQETTILNYLVWSIIHAFGVIEDGHLSRIWGTTLDITDRKMAEEELRESEEKFQKVFMASPYSLIITRIEDDVIIDVNEGFEKNIGFSREETIGHSAIDLGIMNNPADIAKLSRIVTETGAVEDLEVTGIRKDGQEMVVLLRGAVIDLKGEPHRVIVAEDITERKLTEEAILSSENRYRTLFDHTADGICILKGDQFIDVNETWLNMFGQTRDQVIGKTPSDYSPILQPDGRNSQEKSRELFKRAQSGESLSFDWIHTRANGIEFEAEIFLTVIDLSGEQVVLAMVRDMTRRIEAEQAAQEERQRLAHELHDAVSQTLFSASTIAQTLQRTWDNNPDIVHQNLGELQILTQGALAEMRNLLLELRPGALEHIAMPDLLHQLVDGFSGRTKTEIELLVSGDHPLSYNVRFVFFRLAQEALNNIIKHARANQVQVNYDSQPDQVQLIIEDNGRGFDPSIISPGHHGLEIMKERAGTINATIHIKSQVDGGTTVSIIWQSREEPR